MEALFTEKTKAIILNTPHNPLGKVFSRQELEFIANLCRKYNVLCIVRTYLYFQFAFDNFKVILIHYF